MSDILDSLQDIQRNWVANSERGDNRKQMQPFFFNKNIPYQPINQGRKIAFTSPDHLNIHNTPEVRSLRLCDFYDKGHLITDIDRIRRLIGQPTCYIFTVRSLIHHVKCKTDAHFSRTESLKINKTPPIHSRLEMSKRTVIDYDVDKWKKRLNDNTIFLDEVRNTYQMFHYKSGDKTFRL